MNIKWVKPLWLLGNRVAAQLCFKFLIKCVQLYHRSVRVAVVRSNAIVHDVHPGSSVVATTTPSIVVHPYTLYTETLSMYVSNYGGSPNYNRFE